MDNSVRLLAAALIVIGATLAATHHLLLASFEHSDWFASQLAVQILTWPVPLAAPVLAGLGATALLTAAAVSNAFTRIGNPEAYASVAAGAAVLLGVLPFALVLVLYLLVLATLIALGLALLAVIVVMGICLLDA